MFSSPLSLTVWGTLEIQGVVVGGGCIRDKAVVEKKSAVTPSSVCYKEPEKRCLKVFLLLEVFLLLSRHKNASHSAADYVRWEGAFRPQMTLQNQRHYNAGGGE